MAIRANADSVLIEQRGAGNRSLAPPRIACCDGYVHACRKYALDASVDGDARPHHSGLAGTVRA
jgi:hypothetical protein